ncbi:hypothetical protein ABMD26_000667 [Pseudomonas sp. PvP001]
MKLNSATSTRVMSGVDGRVGRFEDHGHESTDQTGQGRRGQAGCEQAFANAPPQAGQFVETMQNVGDAVEQAGTVGRAGCIEVHGLQALQHVLLQRLSLLGVQVQLPTVGFHLAAQIEVGVTTFTLQGMHQAADQRYQLTGVGQPVQAFELAAASGQHETQGRGHRTIRQGAIRHGGLATSVRDGTAACKSRSRRCARRLHCHVCRRLRNCYNAQAQQ